MIRMPAHSPGFTGRAPRYASTPFWPVGRVTGVPMGSAGALEDEFEVVVVLWVDDKVDERESDVGDTSAASRSEEVEVAVVEGGMVVVQLEVVVVVAIIIMMGCSQRVYSRVSTFLLKLCDVICT